MLKELFSNRLFIGALAFFIFCVAGSLLYMHHENQKGAEYDAETQDRVAQWNAKQNPLPTTETPVVEETQQPQQGGHFHTDGTFHAGPHEPLIESTQSASTESTGELVPRPGSFLERFLSRFSPAEAKRAMSAWFEKAGVPPPPRGYEYIWEDAWVVKRDADGNPVINKIGEPYIQVYTITAFAPNPKQARRYDELTNQLLRLHASGQFKEKGEVQAEIDLLVDEAQGPYPLLTAFASGKKAKSKVDQRMKEARDKALVDFGLGHLVGTGIGGR